MVSPKVEHEGLLVPNAVGLTYPRMSEPDQIDFATAANAQWGVVDGCRVTISGFTVMVDPGVVIVNGKLVPVAGGQVTLAGAMAQDRFDSVVINESGLVELLGGTPATDPVFRDVPVNNTLLAVVFCPTGAESYAGMVIDKRRFVSKALLTKIGATEPLIYNANGDSGLVGGYLQDFTQIGSVAACHFSVLGDGYMEWEGDTRLYRSAPQTITIKSLLDVQGDGIPSLASADYLYAREGLTTSGVVSALNLQVSTPAADCPLGSLWQNMSNGDISVKTAAGWKQLAVVDGIMPVGSIIQSVEPPSVMEPKGWLLLDGTVKSEVDWPRLFTLSALSFSGEVGSRTTTLPNYTNRVPRGTNTLGVKTGGKDTISLTVEQMPRHKHNARMSNGGSGQSTVSTGRAGRHTHNIWGGVHTHPVIDPGHVHTDGEWPAGAFVCLVWGGTSKTDALFNDRNHTYSVQAVHSTRLAYTDISISSAASEHAHSVSDEGDHDHTVTVNYPQHVHPMGEDDVGQGLPIDITPSYLATYFYIRA